ncbi:MAG: FecR domain-containing protein [Polyangiaceae bacterium]
MSAWRARRVDEVAARVVRATTAALALVSTAPRSASADDFAFGEEIVQWGTQEGDTCEDIARLVYGEPRYAYLIQRYNGVSCTRGAPLKAGMTLVLPAKVTEVAPAKIGGVRPAVKAKPPGGSWAPAGPGQVLQSASNVSTEEDAGAEIQFVDRTHIYLAENTLVVIYGTASQTTVTTNRAPAIELQEGEVKAALGALRGEEESTVVNVGITGGGSIRATSEDTVVERKQTRTTVAVFDGTAKVENAGAAVQVPTNYGTRFVGPKPPDPPRPLPPAPAWVAGSSSRITIAAAGAGVLTGAWAEVPKAKAYRFEVARDPAFTDLVAREEVPANVHDFRLERLPAGAYFARVRAIDVEDYLGIAAETLRLGLVDATLARGFGAVGEGIVLSAKGAIALGPTPGIEAATEGDFAALPRTLDPAERPARLRLRFAASPETITEIPIEATQLQATLDWSPPNTDLRVTLASAQAFDLDRAAPVAVVHRGGATETIALAPDASPHTFHAAVADPGAVTSIDVLDADGTPLGSTAPRPADAPPPPRAVGARASRIGVTAPGFSLGPLGPPIWWSPSARTGGSVGVVTEGDFEGGAADVSGRLMASGQIGPIGLDVALRTDALRGERVGDPSGWAGVRGSVFTGPPGTIELGVGLRFGFPLADEARAPRLEGGLAVGEEIGKFSWLVDVGTRLQLQEDLGGSVSMPVMIIGGGTFEPVPWLRLSAALDTELLVDTESATCLRCAEPGPFANGGLTLGAEAGTTVFGALSGRVSPFYAALGSLSGQAMLGIRAE